MSQTQEVRASLGCGTLILIAIIVFIFSGNRNYDRLEEKIDNLTEEVKELRRELKAQPEGEPTTNVEQEVERILTGRERRHVKELAPSFRAMFAEMSDVPGFAEEPETFRELLAPLVRIVEQMTE